MEAGYEVQKIAVAEEALFIPVYVTQELNIVNSRTVRGFVGTTWLNSGVGKLLGVWSTRRP